MRVETTANINRLGLCDLELHYRLFVGIWSFSEPAVPKLLHLDPSIKCSAAWNLVLPIYGGYLRGLAWWMALNECGICSSGDSL